MMALAAAGWEKIEMTFKACKAFVWEPTAYNRLTGQNWKAWKHKHFFKVIWYLVREDGTDATDGQDLFF